MILSEKEKAEAAGDVARMILAANCIATLQRKVQSYGGSGQLYGSDDQSYQNIDEDPPIELNGKIDATGSVLPDADVIADDRLKLRSRVYRVQAVHEQYLFGVMTHKSLQLVLLHER
jgi:hypothetical protein